MSGLRTIRRAVLQADALMAARSKESKKLTRLLLRDLIEADQALARRLRGSRMDTAFTAAEMANYRAIIQVQIAYIQKRLRGYTQQHAMRAVGAAAAHSVKIMNAMNAQFLTLPQPRLDRAAVLGPVTNALRGSLLRRHERSMVSYGEQMVAATERIMRQGLITGRTTRQIVAQLTGRDANTGEKVAPGVFEGEKWRAQRIVRTETANAYNASAMQSMFEVRQRFPDTQKKILATFDKRTASDSVYVHGQIKDLDEYFQDGAGRVYLRPPARPNDRETVVPWRATWKESAYTRPKPPTEIERAQRQALGRRGRGLGSGQLVQARRAAIAGEQARQRQMEARQRVLSRQVAAANARAVLGSTP